MTVSRSGMAMKFLKNLRTSISRDNDTKKMDTVSEVDVVQPTIVTEESAAVLTSRGLEPVSSSQSKKEEKSGIKAKFQSLRRKKKSDATTSDDESVYSDDDPLQNMSDDNLVPTDQLSGKSWTLHPMQQWTLQHNYIVHRPTGEVLTLNSHLLFSRICDKPSHNLPRDLFPLELRPRADGRDQKWIYNRGIFTNMGNDMVLTLDGERLALKPKLKGEGKAFQEWSITSYGIIRNAASGLSLDASAGGSLQISVPYPVALTSTTKTNVGQQWCLKEDMIVHSATQMVLTPMYNDSRGIVELVIAPPKVYEQQWTFDCGRILSRLQFSDDQQLVVGVNRGTTIQSPIGCVFRSTHTFGGGVRRHMMNLNLHINMDPKDPDAIEWRIKKSAFLAGETGVAITLKAIGDTKQIWGERAQAIPTSVARRMSAAMHTAEAESDDDENMNGISRSSSVESIDELMNGNRSLSNSNSSNGGRSLNLSNHGNGVSHLSQSTPAAGSMTPRRHSTSLTVRPTNLGISSTLSVPAFAAPRNVHFSQVPMVGKVPTAAAIPQLLPPIDIRVQDHNELSPWDLAKKVSPVIVFHREESNYPCNVEEYVKNARLYSGDITVGPVPLQRSTSLQSYSAINPSTKFQTSQLVIKSEEKCTTLEHARVYFEVKKREEFWDVQYWMFFPQHQDYHCPYQPEPQWLLPLLGKRRGVWKTVIVRTSKYGQILKVMAEAKEVDTKKFNLKRLSLSNLTQLGISAPTAEAASYPFKDYFEQVEGGSKGYQVTEKGRPIVYCSVETHAFYPDCESQGVWHMMDQTSDGQRLEVEKHLEMLQGQPWEAFGGLWGPGGSRSPKFHHPPIETSE
ncbi:hypothetical protein PROFUN_08623 [Planoprotostelium fungivorum]|uniref:Ricin B lectin domain-containing protein n=1 Tax=Planoprotostelium fungivorum TaxID=1890364 RepID=A0A2P6NH05_9EUKA|nr:hypothetical protein PROFUN_09386 [Planoprotostelium fungivorum]PRP84026.1 hypothetical protein PROFUN_08623 [Planoprotostelium fungivorum]